LEGKQRERERKGHWGEVKGLNICTIREHNETHHTKYCFEKENEAGKLVQGALYTSMELSQLDY
jgi:hypothetical protein